MISAVKETKAELENNSTELFQENIVIRDDHDSPDCLRRVIIPVAQMRKLWLR